MTTDEEKKLIAEEAKLSDRERYLLYAYLLTGDKYRTYLYSRETPPTTDNRIMIESGMYKFFRTPKVKAFLALNENNYKKIIAENSSKDNNLTEESEKERKRREYIKELERIASSADDSRRIQAIEKLTKLQDMQTNNNDIQDKHVVYYLPLRCSDCPLYRDSHKAVD